VIREREVIFETATATFGQRGRCLFVKNKVHRIPPSVHCWTGMLKAKPAAVDALSLIKFCELPALIKGPAHGDVAAL
jgi:hypothetical protein